MIPGGWGSSPRDLPDWGGVCVMGDVCGVWASSKAQGSHCTGPQQGGWEAATHLPTPSPHAPCARHPQSDGLCKQGWVGRGTAGTWTHPALLSPQTEQRQEEIEDKGMREGLEISA